MDAGAFGRRREALATEHGARGHEFGVVGVHLGEGFRGRESGGFGLGVRAEDEEEAGHVPFFFFFSFFEKRGKV